MTDIHSQLNHTSSRCQSVVTTTLAHIATAQTYDYVPSAMQSVSLLKNNRVSKLLKVYRYFKAEEDGDSHSDENNFSIVEDSA